MKVTLTTVGCPSPVGASISASPNPIATCDNSPLGATTLTWNTGTAAVVEVHVNAPNGTLFARTGPGTWSGPAPWVTNGMVFYLQDVSAGAPLTSANTLATVTVALKPNACLTSLTVSPLTLSPLILAVDPRLRRTV